MNSGKINIHNANASQLIAVADFLQMDDVKLFCFEFLEENLTVNNCFEMLLFATQYNCPSSLKTTYKLIGENYDLIFQTDNFNDLSKIALASLISKLISLAVQT